MSRALQFYNLVSPNISARITSANPCVYLFREKSWKAEVDFSKVPVLNEDGIEENFIKGGGPGGSNVNKTVSCVSLKHIPTGITVKCQFSRLLHQNRALARESLIEKLDAHLNGEMSVKAQKERLDAKKSLETSRKSRILAELKRKYKLHVEKQGSNEISSDNSDTVAHPLEPTRKDI